MPSCTGSTRTDDAAHQMGRLSNSTICAKHCALQEVAELRQASHSLLVNDLLQAAHTQRCASHVINLHQFLVGQQMQHSVHAISAKLWLVSAALMGDSRDCSNSLWQAPSTSPSCKGCPRPSLKLQVLSASSKNLIWLPYMPCVFQTACHAGFHPIAHPIPPRPGTPAWASGAWQEPVHPTALALLRSSWLRSSWGLSLS